MSPALRLRRHISVELRPPRRARRSHPDLGCSPAPLRTIRLLIRAMRARPTTPSADCVPRITLVARRAARRRLPGVGNLQERALRPRPEGGSPEPGARALAQKTGCGTRSLGTPCRNRGRDGHGGAGAGGLDHGHPQAAVQQFAGNCQPDDAGADDGYVASLTHRGHRPSRAVGRGPPGRARPWPGEQAARPVGPGRRTSAPGHGSRPATARPPTACRMPSASPAGRGSGRPGRRTCGTTVP